MSVSPPVAAPSTAPVSGSGATGHPGGPSLVRQPSASVAGSPGAAALTEKAIASTAVGSTLGASAARAAAQHRLTRLLGSVARQQPRLRWAIADLEDGTTLLATDLAGGWVPPNVEIPTGVKLLKPFHRRGALNALLGPTISVAFHEPGRKIPLTQEHQTVQTSIRARDVAAVADLGWELSQATKWRDGLPRLAHTLARAAACGTGWLESEVVALRECIASVERSVITGYPGAVDPVEVADWQLLATIAALIDDHRTHANYHFAWFQARALSPGVHR